MLSNFSRPWSGDLYKHEENQFLFLKLSTNLNKTSHLF